MAFGEISHYGIVCGWSTDALSEVAAKHRWPPEKVERLRDLRAEVQAMHTDFPFRRDRFGP